MEADKCACWMLESKKEPHSLDKESLKIHMGSSSVLQLIFDTFICGCNREKLVNCLLGLLDVVKERRRFEVNGSDFK